jgi:DNA-binding transcriptional LysR family regulator
MTMEDRFESLNLNLLRVFEALIQEESVTRAAVRLQLTQPAVSNALARLRATFDDLLFEKTRSGVMATSTARALWAMLEPHYRGLRDVLAPPSFDPGEYRGSIRVAMTDFTMERVMPRLGAFLQVHAPQLHLEVVPYTLANFPALLEEGGADIALGTHLDETRQRRGICTHVLWRIEYAVLMRRRHELGRGAIDIQDFLRARHVDVCTQGMAGVYDQILSARGLKRNLVITMPSFQQALPLLKETDCVAVLPCSLIDHGPFAKSLVAVRPPIAHPARDMMLIWHQRHTEVPVNAWLRSALILLFSNVRPPGKKGTSAAR